MAQEMFGQGRGSNLIVQVREGMSVYDSMDEEVGEVDRVYHGAVQTGSDVDVEPATVSRPYRPGEGSVLEFIAEAFDDSDMPEEVAERLLRTGFIRVDSSRLFGSDYYVMPDQISSVSDEQVQLRVSREELIEDDW